MSRALLHWFAGWLLGPAVKRSTERKAPPSLGFWWEPGRGYLYRDGRADFYVIGGTDDTRIDAYLAAIEPTMRQLTHQGSRRQTP